ncbi:MAG TPA: FeoA family protein [Armatimonadota bacterium]|jgi:Fe2+ transport system protein FeoA
MVRASKVANDSGQVSLAELRTGASAQVMSLAAAAPRERGKLMSLGVMPGATVELLQRFPSYIIAIGHTQLALDRETAELIQVLRV